MDWSDDDAVEILDPTPLAFTFPLNPPSADTEVEVHEVAPLAARGGGKKRATIAPTRSTKCRKVSGVKPWPMSTGLIILPAYLVFVFLVSLFLVC
jgi:hypothetical protein